MKNERPQKHHHPPLAYDKLPLRACVSCIPAHTLALNSHSSLSYSKRDLRPPKPLHTYINVVNHDLLLLLLLLRLFVRPSCLSTRRQSLQPKKGSRWSKAGTTSQQEEDSIERGFADKNCG